MALLIFEFAIFIKDLKLSYLPKFLISLILEQDYLNHL
jgi:hypothetical protein